MKFIKKKVIKKDYLTDEHYLCGNCKALLNKKGYMPFNYCPCCGQKIDWDK